MAEKRKILVATTNQGKIAELSAMLEFKEDILWLGLEDFPGIPEIEEDGNTFAENAGKKALGYARATQTWTIADDSGLVIDALNGEPGVKSARFSGEKTNDISQTMIDYRNIEKVLKLMQQVPQEKRTARFVCRLCLASPEKILIETQGALEGLITEKPIGTNGFGYDPIFYIPNLGKTAAQLAADQKNAVSHRGNAIRKLKPLLACQMENIAESES